MSAQRGFSFIDTIVGIALMLIAFVALFGVLRTSLVLSTLAKAKATAIELANTQSEYLRGLSYDALGTIGGIPAGAVPQLATTTIDGVSYVTRTFIQYRDDPADGTGAGDSTGVTTDYKIGKVTVSYSLSGLQKTVDLISNFAPPGVESSTGGGTLSLHVVNKNNENVGDASVRIVNTATNPTIDFTTFTNIGGFAIIAGAATSSQYQIYVSRSGFSNAQTYARAGANVNPTPGYLTVSKDQTTGGTFSIDELATLTIASFSPATTTTFSDTFASAANLASQLNTQVAGGALILASQMLSGSALSTPISPNYLDGWGILSSTIATTSGTTAVVRVDDASGTHLPDSALAGNTAGFSSFPVSLTGISIAAYPTLVLEASLTSNSTSTTPSVLDWSLSHTDGPTPLPNIAFTLTGGKTVGTDANSKPIFKTVVNDTTGAPTTKTETLEWDTYTLSLPSAPLIESCSASPYVVDPATANNASLIVGALTTNTLPLVIENSASSTIANAKIVLTKNGYAAMVPTSLCGFAYFGGLSAGTYSASVSATDHATTTFSGIVVAGHTATTTLILP